MARNITSCHVSKDKNVDGPTFLGRTKFSYVFLWGIEVETFVENILVFSSWFLLEITFHLIKFIENKKVRFLYCLAFSFFFDINKQTLGLVTKNFPPTLNISRLQPVYIWCPMQVLSLYFSTCYGINQVCTSHPTIA